MFFLGEMQTAVAEAEKKIIALHRTVASRDVKLAAADAEVRALKNAVRAHEAKLADGEKLYRARLAAALEERGAKHAEELESARGEVEGNAVMLEMENEQLLKNLDEKRVKIRALQAEHARATEKMRRLRDEAETAKAAEAEAERRRAEGGAREGRARGPPRDGSRRRDANHLPGWVRRAQGAFRGARARDVEPRHAPGRPRRRRGFGARVFRRGARSRGDRAREGPRRPRRPRARFWR